MHPYLDAEPDLRPTPGNSRDVPVTCYASNQPPGSSNCWHYHKEGQLFHVTGGSVAVHTLYGTFYVPPERAVWLPPGVAHSGRYLSETKVRFLYFAPEIVGALPDEPQVIQVTTLLRALILEFMSFPAEETLDGPAARIVAVILDQLKTLPAAPLQLPMPQETRIRALCAQILEEPARSPALGEAADMCAVSPRSFERRIKSETGLSYRTWCRQAKLFRALEFLAIGLPVSEVSDRLGYEGPSAFVASFRKAFGVTPGRYFGPAGSN